jgi:acyl carrier protein
VGRTADRTHDDEIRPNDGHDPLTAAQLVEYLASLLDLQRDVAPDIALEEQVDLDSVTVIELAVILEEDLGIVVDDISVLASLSINDILSLRARR